MQTEKLHFSFVFQDRNIPTIQYFQSPNKTFGSFKLGRRWLGWTLGAHFRKTCIQHILTLPGSVVYGLSDPLVDNVSISRCPSSSSSKKLINPSSFGHMHPNVGVELYGCCRFLGCLDPWRVVEKYSPILRGAQMCLPVLLWVIRSPQGDILKMECTFVVHDVVRV